jgi:predicted metalloprotease
MRWRGGRRGGQIEDRRGMRGGRGAAGGGLGIIAIGLIGYFVFGLDPQMLMQIASEVSGPTMQQEQGQIGTPEDEIAQFVDAIVTSTTDVWTVEFANDGRTYQPPSPLVLYTGATGTQCGMGQAAIGPFYCPADRRIYIDLSFYDELSQRFGAPGDFAQAYVLGHEVGHHIQTLLGTSDQVRRAEAAARSEADANAYSVALELQADCYAGVWAQRVDDVTGGAVALEEGDFEEGRRAAEAIGDDTLQRETQGRVVPDSFTHGTSEQRQYWLAQGYRTGDPDACDTFARLENGTL